MVHIKSTDIFFLGVFSFVYLSSAGCGIVPDRRTDTNPPLSNIRAAEFAIERALENTGLPQSNGTVVSYTVQPQGTGSFFDVLVAEFLKKRGYRIISDDSIKPQFSFCLDTLYVNLVKRNSISGRTIFDRKSLARVSVAAEHPPDSRNVYTGSGIFADDFPYYYRETIGGREEYVHFIDTGEGTAGKAKTLFLGAAVTALMWLLYSYRG